MNACSRFLALLVAAFSLVSPVGAQTVVDARLPEFSMLGMDESQLATRLPDIKRMARPLVGPRGERAHWMASKTILFALPFDTTFYAKNGRIARIEKVWTAPESGCVGGFSFEGVVGQLTAEYGSGQVSNASTENDSVQQSAVWVVDAIQVSLHTEVSPTRCSARLVFQPQVVKDGSEL